MRQYFLDSARSKARVPDFDRVARVNFFLNQNDIVLVKKNQQVATGSCRVTPGFSFPYFFFNPARFQPRVGWVPGRPARFQNYVQLNQSDLEFALQRSSVRVSQTLEPLEAYMVVNFRARGINQNIHKLARISTLIKKINRSEIKQQF